MKNQLEKKDVQEIIYLSKQSLDRYRLIKNLYKLSDKELLDKSK